MVQILMEIIKLQQGLLYDLVNTWNPAVTEKLDRINDLISDFEEEQDRLNAKMEESEQRYQRIENE